MKWMPAKLEAEPLWKKASLGVLVLVLSYLVWTNLFSGGGSSEPAASAPRHGLTPYANVAPESAASQPVAIAAQSRKPASNAAARNASLEDFKPSMKRARLLASDPTKVDPTLRLDLLARLQNAKFEGSMRSLFEFAQAPLPPSRNRRKSSSRGAPALLARGLSRRPRLRRRLRHRRPSR